MKKVCSRNAAVIDLGSHALRLDIYGITGSSQMELLESLSRPVDLGFDVFRTGSVSPECLSGILDILSDYRKKIREYGIETVLAFATSAIRESSNKELVLDRISSAVKLDVEILESPREIKLIYLAMRRSLEKHTDFEKMHGLAVVIGSGSIFVLCFERGLLRFCEELPLGTARMYDAFGHSTLSREYLDELLESSDIPQRIRECTDFPAGEKIDLIIIGIAARRMAALLKNKTLPRGDECVFMKPEAFAGLLEKLENSTPADLSRDYRLSPDDGAELLTGSVVISSFMKHFNCSSICCPGVNTRSAALEYAGKTGKTLFLNDLRSVCCAVGKKYGYDEGHAKETARIALAIYEKLRRNVTFAPGSDILLELAALLHDIGRFVDTRSHHLHSHYLIKNMQLPGLESGERLIAALISRYHRKDEPDLQDQDYATLSSADRVTVQKLAAILRVADSLDCSRQHRFHRFELLRQGRSLIFRVPDGDFSGERLNLASKGGMFKHVFGLDISIEGV